jgi:hypothetical protein
MSWAWGKGLAIGFGPQGKLTATEMMDLVLKRTVDIAIPHVENWLALYAPEDLTRVRPDSLMNKHIASLKMNAGLDDQIDISPGVDYADIVNAYSGVNWKKKTVRDHYQQRFAEWLAVNHPVWVDAARWQIMNGW